MSKEYLNFFYQYTRGLRSKIVHGLRDQITLENFDIIGLTETWLYDDIDSESIFTLIFMDELLTILELSPCNASYKCSKFNYF